jgi:hypothetical protein
MKSLIWVSCQGNALEPYKRGWSRGTRGFKGFTVLDTSSNSGTQPTLSIERNHTKKPIKSKLKFLIFRATDVHRSAIKLSSAKPNHPLIFLIKKAGHRICPWSDARSSAKGQYAAPGFCRKPDSGLLTVSENGEKPKMVQSKRSALADRSPCRTS